MGVKNLVVLYFLFLCLSIGCSKEKSNPLQTETNPTSFKWLKTVGSNIVDEDGKVMIVRGVNRSGLEYDKTGAGVSQAEIEYIVKTWKAQIIRLPFNQDWIMRDPG